MNTDACKYWWLNTNPKVWDVNKLGFFEEENTHNAEGKKRRVYSNYASVRQGDVVIGYETSPTRKVVAIYKVTKGIHKNTGNIEVITLEILEKLNRTVNWDDIKGNPGLKDSEPVKINNRGSLFSLTLEEFQIIKGLVSKT